ncbi:FAD-dependent monooxygenase [Agaribacter marinus]|uniref:2-octaprenyl-6-methoxyphenyl hydroxylase n=1 Tax=Agaribacter marinus TaxID=1431249 RepID=A0AA37WIH4_9ALTE|nr:FAD-dependent monooxygenase [Agaribacter marinus]GLR71028.1 2-octaprenyl-6-methoxyphenyl hydroxylase [Agaribacter marinus]
MQTKDVDVLIAGGGVAGCVAALAIKQLSNYSVAIIEKSPPSENTQHPSFDAKVIALAKQSLTLLKRFGISVANVDTATIEKIHVSDRKHIGQTLLDAKQLGVDYFGKVVRLEQLGFSIYEQVKNAGIDYIAPDSINALERKVESVEIMTEKAHISAKLLVVAEGANSPTRQRLNIPVHQYDYQQTAIVSNVELQLAHQNQAFERFTKYGPLAFLPLHKAGMANNENLMSVVWTMPTHKAPDVLNLSDDKFCAELQTLFGYRLGKIGSASPRFSYPLLLKQTHDYASHRVICIANAAQSLHPIAGQGFNLGIRDIDRLIHSFLPSVALGSFEHIAKYKTISEQDKDLTINATDSLVSVFSNHHLPLVLGRNLGLKLLNGSQSMKSYLATLAMGVK